MTSLLGWTATILFTLCYVPQIIKMTMRKKVEDISFLFFFLEVIGNIVALIYAIRIQQAPLQIKYIAGLILSILVLFFYFKYAKQTDTTIS